MAEKILVTDAQVKAAQMIVDHDEATGRETDEATRKIAEAKPRATGADRSKLAADLKRRYEAGESIGSLAASTGRSYGFIHRMLSESGVKLRGRGGATRGKSRGER
jgi:Helix-turn-helix domain